MNKIVYLAAVLASVSAFAQGSVNFKNKVTADGVNAPVYDVNGTTPLVSTAASPSFYVQLYAGADANSLAPVGTAIATLTAGYFAGGEVDIASLKPGTGGTFQVRAWQATTSGAQTYEAAVGAGLNAGRSPTFALSALGDPNGSPPGLPVSLVGLQSFSLVGVPEPTTLALGALGALSLLAFRRK